MSQKDAESTILRKSYQAYFRDWSAVNLHAIRDELDMAETPFWNTVDDMTHQGFVSAHTMGGNYIIRPKGIIHAEELGIAPQKLVRENQHIRTMVLDKLATVRDEKGAYADARIESMAEEFGVDKRLLAYNLEVMCDLGYVEPVAMGSYSITHSGIDAVAEWKQRTGFAEEFEYIGSLQPQPRGRALQELLARVIAGSGWSQDEGARTSHEEMDVVIHKEREYFLIECKWEKEPVQAGVVRELYGKLGNRIGVQGIVVSMSGFTSGAVTQAEDYASERVILFFGPEDVHQLIFEQAAFDDLLNEKYGQLITYRKTIYD